MSEHAWKYDVFCYFGTVSKGLTFYRFMNENRGLYEPAEKVMRAVDRQDKISV
jgi:hypothetical protein